MSSYWVSTSLFSPKRNWPIILREGIGPLLNQLKDVQTYRLRFNYLNGSNLQFALLIQDIQCESVARDIDRYFKEFFCRTSLKTELVSIPPSSLFIPYPQNCIQYGLYQINVKVEEERNDSHEILSNIILNLVAEGSDDISILTLALYLHLILIKQFNKKSNIDFKAFFSEIFPTGENGKTVNQKMIDEAYDFFEKNKEIIKMIIEDVFIKKLAENNELVCLSKWEEVCNRKLDNGQVYKKEIYQAIKDTISDFLGFNSEVQFFINCVVNSIVNKILCDRFEF